MILIFDLDQNFGDLSQLWLHFLTLWEKCKAKIRKVLTHSISSAAVDKWARKWGTAALNSLQCGGRRLTDVLQCRLPITTARVLFSKSARLRAPSNRLHCQLGRQQQGYHLSHSSSTRIVQHSFPGRSVNSKL